jgi:hypothetical protein
MQAGPVDGLPPTPQGEDRRMTELAHYHGAGAVAEVAPTNELVSWADGAAAAYRVAEQLVETSFVPQGFRGKPYEATAAILSGQEIGLSPMAALRSFDVIQGIAAPRAITLRAIVQSRGHRMWVAEANSTRAIVRGVRAGEQQVQESKWDMDRAKALNLTGKDNWRKQPQAMLVARATAECARLIAADAIHGIPYTAEELDDQGEVKPEPTQTVKPAAKRTARRTPVEPKEPVAPAEPDFDEEPPASAPADEQPRQSAYSAGGNRPAGEDVPITEPQLRMIHASYSQIGIEDRQERLDFAAATIGRQIESSKDLTKGEASRLIDALAAHAPQDEPPLDEDQP